MSFRPYPKYKESGVEWLGRVPENWSVTRLKHIIASIASGTSVNSIDAPAGDGDVGVLKTSCVYRGYFEPDENKQVVDAERHLLSCPLKPGSLIVSRMNTPDLIGAAGLVLHARPDLYLPDRLWQVTLHEASAAFVYWWTRSVGYRMQVEAACTGTSASMKNLAQDEFQDFKLLLPPTEEQSAVAAFLGHETAKIDALIAEQQRLIELLQEKRQAVISHAVTKGLNPDAPMKDSGIEWLGKVPEHWEVVRLRYLCKIQTGSRDTENAVEDGIYPFFVRSETVERINTFAADCEAVLTAGDGAGVGKVFHHFQGQFDFHQRVYMMNDFRSVTGRFLYHYLRTNFYKVALEGTAKSTVDSLRRPMFTGFPVAVPPSEEQASIVGWIQERAGQFDGLVAQATIAITLLQERRSALISAAVTGQIDVRGFTADGSEAA